MKMKIDSKDFRVRPRKKVHLSELPTIVKPFCRSPEEYQKLLGEHVDELSSLQRLHYASDRYALLLIFQGMDAAGKDGAIRHVMSGPECRASWLRPRRCVRVSRPRRTARRASCPARGDRQNT